MSIPSIPLGPFTHTATSDLGEQRNEMLSNQLLLRTKVGIPTSRGNYLPGKGFTYGHPNDKRTDTALEALRGWGMSFKSVTNEPKKHMGRNFMALNRMAVSAGLATAPEFYDYRTKYDVRLNTTAVSRFALPLRLPADMVFGRPARPGTPMGEVLEHKFQSKWINKHYKQELIRRQKEEKKKKTFNVYDNRATLLRTFQNPVDDKPLWQMPRFASNAKPHLQTFRTSKDKAEALHHFDSDRISRQGVKGQGVYEGAKN